MAKQFRIAPSILSANFAKLGQEITDVITSGTDLVHFDVMDNHFVPNLTLGLPVVEAIVRQVSTPVDCHLMISDPQKYAPAFIDAGADSVSVHYEAATHLDGTLQTIRKLGRGSPAKRRQSRAVEQAARRGACRFPVPGTGNHFDVPWDGIPLVSRLTRWVLRTDPSPG